MKRKYSPTVLLIGFSLVINFNCKPSSPVDSFDIAQKYIAAYTSGIIQRTSPIRITFNQSVVAQEETNTPIGKNPIQIEPNINGSSYWENTQTLVFSPDELLPVNTSFEASLALKDIMDQQVTSNEKFNFSFATRPQSISVDVADIAPTTENDYSSLDVLLHVKTADVATTDEIVKALKVSQDKQPAEVEWETQTTSSLFVLRVKNVARKTKESKLQVSWEGKSLGSKDSGEQIIDIPGKDEFLVWQVSIEPDDESHIVVLFSDPIDSRQALTGLIRIENYSGNLRFLTEGNKIRIYHDQTLVGQQRLIISDAIKNSKGKSIAKENQFDIEFVPAKPQVRLTGTGNIVAEQNNKYILPVEVLNLHTVEIEVFKIFSSNVLQYMQFEAYESEWEMRKVGRIVHREIVRLDVSGDNRRARQWQRYGIDMSHMITADPDALFQVRIGFRPEHVTLPCAALLTKEPSVADLTNEAAEFTSFFDDYYGIFGYSNDYNWSLKDDPCAYEYYNREKFVSRTLFPSNLGLIAKKTNAGKWMVITTQLEDARPLQGVDIHFYDMQQQLISRNTTNADGIVEVQLDREPFVVTAQNSISRSYLKVSDGTSLQMSRFDIAGVAPKKGIKGYIYGERDVWRPGDSLHLYCILEHELTDAAIPLTYELMDPRGASVHKNKALNKSGPLYSISTGTRPDAPTGDYRIIVKYGAASFSKTLKIENIKPNRLKVDYQNRTPEVLSSRKAIEGSLKSSWLHGATASGLFAKIEMLQQNIKTTFKAYESYVFDDPARKPNFSPVVIYSGNLDGNGTASVSYNLSTSQNLPGKQMLLLKSTVEESGGDFSLDQQSIMYSPFSHYTGIKLPKDKYNQNRIDLNTTTEISFVVLDEKGKPAGNRSVDIGLYEVGWRWWWDNYEDYVQEYATTTHRNALQTYSITTDQKGIAKITVNIDHWGRYLIRACLPNSGHCAGDFFYSGYPWYDDQNIQSEASILSVTISKEKYAPGDEVEIMVPSTTEGKLFISLENGSKIVKTMWQDAKPGNNTIKFRATGEMAPNVYANIMLVQPHEGMNIEQPLRMFGVIPVFIEDPATRLQPVINMAKELEGEKEFTVEIKEAKGQEMHYSIAIVDEGLLDLTRFKTPDPHLSFFAKEALGVWTWDYFDKVLGRYVGGSGRLMSIGGDAEVRVEGAPQASRFPPVVLQSGPRYLKKGQSDKVTFKMPNYAGSVRVMVVAADHRKYGNADKTVKVRKPLMVLATLPRVLGPGETFSIPVNLFSLDKKVKKASVTIHESNGLAEFTSGTKFNVSFDASGEEMIYIPVKMKSSTGVAQFKIEAKGDGFQASYEADLLVRLANTMQSKTEQFQMDKGKSLDHTFRLMGLEGTNSAELEVSTIPPLNLANHLNYLINYPHGCLEQTLSTAFPQLFLADITDLSDQQNQRVNHYVRNAIAKVQQHTTSTGGLANWVGNHHYDGWVSSYATHFLISAKEKGYYMNEKMLENLINHHKQVARNWKPQTGTDPFYYQQNFLIQAYRLYVLALASKPELASMNLLKEHKQLDNTSTWLLAAAYAHSGRKNVADKLIENAEWKTNDYPDQGYTYGSKLRDMSLILESALIIGRSTLAAELAKNISDQLNENNWYSTQTLAQALSSLSKYYQEHASSEGLKFEFSVNNGKKIKARSDKDIFYVNIDLSTQPEQKLSLKNETDAILFVRIVNKGIPKAGDEQAGEHKIKIDVTYRLKNGVLIDPNQLEQGQEFEAHATITRPNLYNQYYKDIALTQVFPSGWEIINTRMDFINNPQNGNEIVYQDIKDDRVLTYINMLNKSTVKIVVPLKATYNGNYYLPAHRVEAMYNGYIHANNAGKWVQVERRNGSI